MAEEDIAAGGDGNGPVDVSHVHASIQTVLAWQQANALPIVTTTAHEIILKHMSSLDSIIGEFATATRTRTVQDRVIRKVGDKEEVIFVPREVIEIDYDTRARVITHLKELRDMVASKETKTNVNFGTQVGTINAGTRSFENRMYKRREARGLKNAEDSAELEAIQDGEYDDDLDDELDEPEEQE